MNVKLNDLSSGIEDELEPLWRFALKLTGNSDDAADLVQRTCLRALERRDSYIAQGKLRSWLFRIEHRIWLNELRSRQIRNHQSFSTGYDESHDVCAQSQASHVAASTTNPESSVLLHQVHDVVESLPEAQRLVMLLVCVEGFTYRETADILELPLGTVMSRLSRARMEIGKRMLASKPDESSVACSTLTGVHL